MGVPASFTIQLVGEDGKNLDSGGIVHDHRNVLKSFIYVWIANGDQVKSAWLRYYSAPHGSLPSIL